MGGSSFFRAPILIAAASLASAAVAATLSPSAPAIEIGVERIAPARKKRASLGFAEGTPRWKRSRGAQAKRKKRPNMRHVSKRVRRKHRRAR